MPQRSLRALVRDCRRGEPAAWDEVLDRYGRLMWSVALRHGLRGDEAEEVFQRSWVAVVEGIQTLKQADRLSSWIAGTVRNHVLRYFDERSRERRGVELPELESPTPDIADLLERQQEMSALRDALDQLDPRCRQLLSLLFLEQPSPDYQEISRLTGLAVGSIGPIRARCLKRLRRLFVGLYQASTGGDS